MNKNIIRALLALTALASGYAVSGCKISEPCDAGQEFHHGYCLPEGGQGGGAGHSGDDDHIDEDHGEATSPTEMPNVGAVCTVDGAECRGGTTCALPLVAICVALCGPGDAFENECPTLSTCQEVQGQFVCRP